MLYLGDCLEILPTLDSGFFDLTITSPPYDNLRSYNNTLSDWTQAKWKAIISELYRVTKSGGVVVWVVADATIDGSETGTSFRQALHAIDCGFRLHDTMIWRKPDPTPQTREGRRYTSAYEFMFVFCKGRLATFNEIRIPCKFAGAPTGGSTQRVRNGGVRIDRLHARSDRANTPVKDTKPAQNVWDFSRGQSREHPAVFPEALARDHILSWSNEGDMVFDPFLGSGTTGKVAIAAGRNFIGIERDPTYFAIAERRIAESKSLKIAAE